MAESEKSNTVNQNSNQVRGGHSSRVRSRGRGRTDPHVAKALHYFGVPDLRDYLNRKHEEEEESQHTAPADPSYNFLNDPLRESHRNQERSHQPTRSRSGEPTPRHSRGKYGSRSSERIPQFIKNPSNILVELTMSTGEKNYTIDKNKKIADIRHIPDDSFADLASGINSYSTKTNVSDEYDDTEINSGNVNDVPLENRRNYVRGRNRDKGDFMGRGREFRGRGNGDFRGRSGEIRGRGGDFRGRGGDFRGRGGDFRAMNFDSRERNEDFRERNDDFRGRGIDFRERNDDFRERNYDLRGRGIDFRERNNDVRGRGIDFRERNNDVRGRGIDFRGRGIEFRGRGADLRWRGGDFRGRGNHFRGSSNDFRGRANEFEQRYRDKFRNEASGNRNNTRTQRGRGSRGSFRGRGSKRTEEFKHAENVETNDVEANWDDEIAQNTLPSTDNNQLHTSLKTDQEHSENYLVSENVEDQQYDISTELEGLSLQPSDVNTLDENLIVTTSVQDDNKKRVVRFDLENPKTEPQHKDQSI